MQIKSAFMHACTSTYMCVLRKCPKSIYAILDYLVVIYGCSDYMNHIKIWSAIKVVF